MATAVYLEHYLDSLESLPMELSRNFNLMRDLDSKSQDLLKEIDEMADSYLTNVKDLSNDKRKEQLSKIQTMFSKSKEFGDDKVQLAMQTYEMVDKHIRKLDADLARFEAELKEKAADVKKDGYGGTKDTKKKKKDTNSKDNTDDGKKKKRKSNMNGDEDLPQTISGALSPPISLALGHASDVLDMPVDPNEPTYCLCHQVSYGEMIGCDNPDCPIEWFHFVCVGLTAKPKGRWYCPRCSVDKKKKV
ncbi:hypothetical protein HELRODRAFT_184897 [Helobdella robusta]|uniref:Inhibitor of growth protein n=1 Tax=Helobdella robusta TaxID=6412 RepID=T1FM50_HELRO|nr:hypothetical protein HELRODRAFT_184897 [Helobdella robusta]ESO05837.1 hypothetical protein HELRODRAFT_184897 [Helobdella robusta]